MNIAALKAELADDILGRVYSGMSDAEVAADLNTVYRTRNKTSLTGSEVLNAVVKADFLTLDAADKQMIWDIIHLGIINPFGIEADLFIDVFEAGSATIIALQELRVESISRAVEIGLGIILETHVTHARSYHDN